MIKSRQDKKLTMLCARRLRAARQKNFKGPATEFARHIGVKESTYTSHENGTRSYTVQDALKYAKHLRGVSASYLMGIGNEAAETVEVEVMGEVTLAAWIDKALDRKQNRNAQSLPIPNQRGDPVRFAIKINDESVNKVIPQGGYAICVPIEEDELVAGLLVYIEHARGNLVQKSIRRVSAHTKAGFYLKTFSTLHVFDASLNYPAEVKGETITLMGRVIGQYGEIDLV